MNDLINRQEAINDLREKDPSQLWDTADVEVWVNALPAADAVPRWIPCSERLPENANKLGAFCPRYYVMTKYGITEGWYNPDRGCWYVLLWFLHGMFTEEYDIDLTRGDIPKVAKGIDVIAWMPLPEPYKEEENGND